MTTHADMTIKELAEKLGISKQAVRRYFDQLPSALVPKKTNGTYQISIEAQNFITNKVLRVDIHKPDVDTKLDTNKPDVDTKLDTNKPDVDTSDSVKQKSIQRELIDDKNEQINSLRKQIDKLHTLLDQQQQLTLQSNKQIEQLQLQLDTRDNVQSVQDDPDSSKVTESIEQLDLLNQLKNELETSKSENEHLKNTISSLNEAPKKGFWKRLFDS